MRPINLEFLHYRYASAMGWGLLGVGLVLVAGSLFVAAELNSEVSRLRSELPAGTGFSGAAASPEPLTAAAMREQAAALTEMQRVSAQLSRPWERLFQTLESLPRTDVALLALNCNASTGHLRLTAEARNFEAMLALHRELEDSLNLSDVSLLKHEIVNRQNERPVLFNLIADWEVQDARF